MTASLIALYKLPADPERFDEYYFKVHCPLAEKIPGLQRLDIQKIVGSPSGTSEYYLMAQLHFKDMDALKTGLSSPEGKATGKDTVNFAKDILTLMIAQSE